MLLPTLGKFIHRAFRSRLAKHYHSASMPLQLGGKQGQSTTFVTHTVRSHIRAAVTNNTTCAVVFCDISSAYYAAIRGLTAGSACAKEFDVICESLPISKDDRVELQRHLSAPRVLEQDGAERWLQLVAEELNSTTWMTLAGDSGSPGPGSASADITFGLMVKRVLACRDSLGPTCTASAVPRLVWNGLRGSCLMRPGANSVATQIATEAGCLNDAFGQHGLTLAFGAHNTTAICVVRGPDSRAARKKLSCGKAGTAVGSIPVLRDNREATMLLLVDCYKNLGVVHNALKQELRCRVGQAWAAFCEVRRRLFKSSWVDISAAGFLAEPGFGQASCGHGCMALLCWKVVAYLSGLYPGPL